MFVSLQWHHNGRDRVSNHRRFDCFLNRIFMRRPKKTSKLRVTGRWPVNSPYKGASNTENVPIWWRHHVCAFHKLYPSDDECIINVRRYWVLSYCTVLYWMLRHVNNDYDYTTTNYNDNNDNDNNNNSNDNNNIHNDDKIMMMIIIIHIYIYLYICVCIVHIGIHCMRCPWPLCTQLSAVNYKAQSHCPKFA